MSKRIKNNIYNFKNTIRFFVDITNVIIPTDITAMTRDDIDWTIPFNFQIRKNENQSRTLKIPNILNFFVAFNIFKQKADFIKIDEMDIHKRMNPNIITGDFASKSYKNRLTYDLTELCKYDLLIRIDIKDFYNRIYTHNLGYDENTEKTYTSMNRGQTNGLIMGTYISLYIAENFLTNISDDLSKALKDIDCNFSYFSDDFYFYCNTDDKDKIIKIFDEVLSKYELERNNSKLELWDYEKYSSFNVVEQYWRTIVKLSEDTEYRNDLKNIKRIEEKKEEKRIFLPFTNQLIYRINKITDTKLKRIFIINFFKSSYFYDLDFSKFVMDSYNYHQICYLFKMYPETMLYANKLINGFDCFKSDDFKKFLRIRYKEALKTRFYDEQIYFFYSLKKLGYDDILKGFSSNIYQSDNQILISYYINHDFFNSDELEYLKSIDDESKWLQNYTLILKTDLYNDLNNNINKYLIPNKLRNVTKDSATKRIKNYFDFYKGNLSKKIELINDIEVIDDVINEYLTLKKEERKRS